MKDKVKKVKVELIAKDLVMSERHQVKLVKIEIFGASPASPVTRDTTFGALLVEKGTLTGGVFVTAAIDAKTQCLSTVLFFLR